MESESQKAMQALSTVMEKAPCVGDVYQLCTRDGKFRVWKVQGVFLGALNQESVIQLKTLDRTDNTEGDLLVPYDMFRHCLNFNRA